MAFLYSRAECLFDLPLSCFQQIFVSVKSGIKAEQTCCTSAGKKQFQCRQHHRLYIYISIKLDYIWIFPLNWTLLNLSWIQLEYCHKFQLWSPHFLMKQQEKRRGHKKGQRQKRGGVCRLITSFIVLRNHCQIVCMCLSVLGGIYKRKREEPERNEKFLLQSIFGHSTIMSQVRQQIDACVSFFFFTAVKEIAANMWSTKNLYVLLPLSRVRKKKKCSVLK